MCKFFVKSFFILFLLINNAMAFSDARNSSSLNIQISNLSFITNLPRHDFAYAMTIPDAETHDGDPLQGTLAYETKAISTVIYRTDDNNIEVYLRVTDPAIGGANIWSGKIIYNKSLNKIETLPDSVDKMHYTIKFDARTDQGQPQLIMGIICG